MADFNFVETDSAKIYTDIIGNLMDYCNEPLYPGDERRIFGEGLVQVLVGVFSLFDDKAKQRTLRYARGSVLDAIGERYGVERLAPANASATFRFTASASQIENIVIPAGTRITADGNVYFTIPETAILPAGDAYVDVLGVCISGGSEYNGFAAGSISTLVDLIPYISSAVNITATSGGDDGEPYTEAGDENFRERIRHAPASLSTAGPESAYRYFALSADPDILDVAIVCPEDEPNTVNIYPLMTGGALPDEETLQKVLNVLGDDVRPMTDKVQALTPNVVQYSVEIKYYCTRDDEASTIQTIEGVGGAIDKYNEWQTSALGRNINPDQLRRFILAPTDGMGALRVEVVRPTYIELSKSEVAQMVGSPIVTHEVVSG